MNFFLKRILQPLHQFHSRAMSIHSAGIIVIGDEILKGLTLDTNSHFMCKRLHSFGIKVKQVITIPDDLKEISKHVLRFSDAYNYVFTSGGVGPTHDDITFEGVGLAFGEEMCYHSKGVELISNFFKIPKDFSLPPYKMVYLPKSANLNFGFDLTKGRASKYPVVSVRNVYILPGVPGLCQKAFSSLESIFRENGAKFYVEKVFLNCEEFKIAQILTSFNEKHKDSISLGSYPHFGHNYYKVKLVLESTDCNKLNSAKDELLHMLPSSDLFAYDENPYDRLGEKFRHFLSSSEDRYRDLVNDSIAVISKAFDTYDLSELCVSFNGGKDCTLLLHLIEYVLSARSLEGQVHCFYCRGDTDMTPFPEIERFIQETRARHSILLHAYDLPLKQSLSALTSEFPDVKAIFMGTRQLDMPSKQLEVLAPTDHGWPDLMRVNPILHWHYPDVWALIRGLSLPYCELYDKGFTSLGHSGNTKPNPKLQYVDERGVVGYKPAYLLEDHHTERYGRMTDSHL